MYARVWQHAAQFKPESASRITWLATIAQNRALDEAKRKQTTSIEEHPEVFLLSNGDDPHVECEENERGRRLLTCLDLLEPGKKELLLQAHYYGMTREDIAQRLGRSVSTVKTWLRRSLAELRAHASMRDE